MFVSKYDPYTKDVLKHIRKGDKVCYITFNKTAESLIKILNKKGAKDAYIVDGISKTFRKPKKIEK